MGKLIKNHWARLIILAAASYHLLASIASFLWPKIFFDFLTTNLDPLVKPYPILQTINLGFALFILALEWPLPFLAGSMVHRSIEFRLLLYPLAALLVALLYEGSDVALYYVIGVGLWFWAYCCGEVICATPWTLPSKRDMPTRENKATAQP